MTERDIAEQLEKQKAYANKCGDATTSAGVGGALGADYSTKSTRDNFSDRVQRAYEDSCSQAQHREDLGELRYLLNKHPEVARILDLIGKVGVS